MSVDTSGATASAGGEEGVRRRERVTVPGLLEMKRNRRKIVVVTAYDFPSARLAERAEIDIVLVGDTLGLMVLGYDTTLPVTLDDMEYHVRAVRRGLRRTLLLADMPFGTYQIDSAEAVRNAVRLMQSGAQAVKIEGGAYLAETIRRMTETGIPVMAHSGIDPAILPPFWRQQSSGNGSRGGETDSRRRADATGSRSVRNLLEAIPAELALRKISEDLTIPTIGIGAGPGCDGEVQVWHDILGIPPGKGLRHTKKFAELGNFD